MQITSNAGAEEFEHLLVDERKELEVSIEENLAKNYDIHKEEYKFLAERYERQLALHGVLIDELPVELMEKVKAIAGAACLLDCRDVSTGGIVSSFLRLKSSVAREEYRCKSAESRLDFIRVKSQAASLRLAEVEHHLSYLEEKWPISEAKSSEWKHNAMLLRDKHQDYQKRWESLKSMFDELGVEKDGLLLKDLDILNDKLISMEKDFNSMQSQLKAYQDLPPDLTLSKIMLDEKCAQLEDLRSSRDEKLRGIVSSIDVTRSN